MNSRPLKSISPKPICSAWAFVAFFFALVCSSASARAQTQLPIVEQPIAPLSNAPFSVEKPRRTLEASWHATLARDSAGYSLAFSPLQGQIAPFADAVEPNAQGVFAIGVDTLDPPTDNPFNADGNIDNRPQREISLHWNGVEVANRFCPVELKSAIGAVMTLRVEAVVGGSEVSVQVDKTPVYDRFFVPDLRSYPSHTLWSGAATISDAKVKGSGPGLRAMPPPMRVLAFDKALNDGEHQHLSSEIQFPGTTRGIGRVVCTLTLGPTPKGLDPWDRLAQLFLFDEKGERFEILRYITPYNRAYTWNADVTDFLPLLTGHKKMELFCETWAAGWLVSVDFRFYAGALEKVPYKVVNLWNVTADIGRADKPFVASVPPEIVVIDERATQVKARFCVTGHGQAPNTANAAEFIGLWRRFFVGTAMHQNTLWKTDNYLNPCRPQGGTWKYDRAGWAPGDVVTPWLVDITGEVKRGRETTLRYETEPFRNETPDGGNPARHVIESQLIFYSNGNP